MQPPQVPIGLLVARTAKAAGRAFDEVLAEAGGSQPTWLILLSLVRGGHRTQGELATMVGVRGPTLTHHLAALEEQGLVVRARPEGNRRVQVVSLTDAGWARFHQLRAAAGRHDARLRRGFDEAELDQLRDYLARLADNLERPPDDPAPTPDTSSDHYGRCHPG